LKQQQQQQQQQQATIVIHESLSNVKIVVWETNIVAVGQLFLNCVTFFWVRKLVKHKD
jgi:hypothetical protein